MNKKTCYIWVLAFTTILMVLSGCANSSSGSSTSSLKAGPGVDVTNKTITLGILSPYSGPVADPIGIPLAKGIEVYFDSVNASGGIDGYKVKFLEEDTQYNPQLAVQLYNQIHTKVLMIADSLGTPPTFAIKDLASADHMLVSAATLSSALAREKYLILVGTPYRLQVENAFDYVVKKLGVQNPAVGIIYQNDEYGQDGLTGYKEAAELPACRWPRAARHRPKPWGTPTAPWAISVRRRHRSEDTGNRVSVNGARTLIRATGAGSNFRERRSVRRQDRLGGAPSPGDRWLAPQAAESGNRRPWPNMGIARRAFGHDGRCVGRAKANARRSAWSR
jgi:hypothetical protein